MKILPKQMTQVFTGGYPTHTPDGSAVYAYLDESFSNEKVAGTLLVGSVISRILTKPIYKEVLGAEGQNLTAMLVVPQTGDLQGQRVWIIGNVTILTDCRKN